MVVSSSPPNFRFDKSFIIPADTFRFAVLEKHVEVKIYEEAIKYMGSSNILHGLNLFSNPPSRTKNVHSAGTANIHGISLI